VTKPFPFRKAINASTADEGIRDLKSNVDTLIAHSQLSVCSPFAGRNTSILETFRRRRVAPEGRPRHFRNSNHGGTCLSISTSNDVRTINVQMGMAHGWRQRQRRNRASEGGAKAISARLLEDVLDPGRAVVWLTT